MRTDVTLDEWIAALDSGEYRKARGALRLEVEDGYRHCCLGVLCELAETEWSGSCLNKDMRSSKGVDCRMFGPEIGAVLARIVQLDDKTLRVDTHLVALNDLGQEEDYSAVVKFLRDLPVTVTRSRLGP